jgi:hypothetical protein
LGGDEALLADQSGMAVHRGHDPVVEHVPPPYRDLARDLVAGSPTAVVGVLPVPGLPAGVAGVGEDRGDRVKGPGFAAAVAVAVDPGRAGDSPLVERSGDPGNRLAGKPLDEDPPDMRSGSGVGFETVQTSPPAGVRPVGMRPASTRR